MMGRLISGERTDCDGRRLGYLADIFVGLDNALYPGHGEFRLDRDIFDLTGRRFL